MSRPSRMRAHADSPSHRRSPTLRVQLAIAFVAVAILSVAVAAVWANHISAQQIAAYQEWMRAEVPWMTDTPPEVQEVFLRSADPLHVAVSQRRFLAAFNRSLWVGGAAAGLLGLFAAVLLARRFADPLRDLHDAASSIGRGDLTPQVAPAGGGELEDVAVAFNAMALRLQESERLRRELLAAVAHELRNPLAIIQGNLEGMLVRSVDPTPERIGTLYTQSALLTRLIADLRDLSLAEAGQLTLNRRPTDLSVLCREAVEVMQPWIDERGVQVEIEVGDGSMVDADPDRMRQIIHNLLHNGIRYARPQGHVRASSHRTETVPSQKDGARIALLIEDDGPGIPSADLPYVFEAFYRADPSRSRASGGSGLGLTVVKHLAAAHGGDVRAENLPGRGIRFTLRLPAAAQQAPQSP